MCEARTTLPRRSPMVQPKGITTAPDGRPQDASPAANDKRRRAHPAARTPSTLKLEGEASIVLLRLHRVDHHRNIASAVSKYDPRSKCSLEPASGGRKSCKSSLPVPPDTTLKIDRR